MQLIPPETSHCLYLGLNEEIGTLHWINMLLNICEYLRIVRRNTNENPGLSKSANLNLTRYVFQHMQNKFY